MIKKLLFPALIGAMAMFTACETDPCKDLEGKCGTGTCFEGTCVCDEGYEADADGVCNVKWATKFVGNYTGTDCGFALASPVVITELSATSIEILNFGGFETIGKVTATVSGSKTLTIKDDNDTQNRAFDGTATIDGNTITGSYKVTYPDGTSENCTFTYTK